MGSMAEEVPTKVATRRWDPVLMDWAPWVPVDPPGYAQRDTLSDVDGCGLDIQRASWVERTCRPALTEAVLADDHSDRPDPDRTAQGHYTFSEIEPIDVIEAWGLGFNRGNALKYLARAGRKGTEVEDLRKARSYITREINRLEGRASWDPEPRRST